MRIEPAVWRGTVAANSSAWRQAATSGVGNSCRYAAPAALRINFVAPCILERRPESGATGEEMAEDAESPWPAPMRNTAIPVVHDALRRGTGNPAAVCEPL